MEPLLMASIPGLLLLCAISLQASSPETGSISGTVFAGSGATFPNAQVRAVHDSSGNSVTVTAAYSGKYQIENLAPGRYRVTVSSAKGYPTLTVEVTSGKTTTANLSIQRLTLSPEHARPLPMTMQEWSRKEVIGVSVAEVSDYVFGGYRGEFPSPPHADGNPRRAFVIRWEGLPYRFVFSHEGSYCPWFEFPSGAGLCYQFLEGNEGWAELFNDFGRKERNSYVEVVESGPSRVWMRWTYFGVNMDSGAMAYRATEDFWAYPNGLILRRQVYRTLMPGDHRGYTREPIEMIGLCPVGKLWFDVLAPVPKTGESHALAALDPFSSKRYDVYWKRASGEVWSGTARRAGADWREIDDAPGVALVVPMKDGSPFCIFGDASGYRHDYTRIKEHSHSDTGGVGWVSSSWDHWPIGWLNSQAHPVDAVTLPFYPNHFSPAGMDFFALPNEESERGIYYSLIGVGGENLEEIRRIARDWLRSGPSGVANPDTLKRLRRRISHPVARDESR
jgi:hypothetical protein